MTATHAFRSMGCDVRMHGGDVDAAERLFAERDARFSRFLAGSELDRVNARAYGADLLSPDFAAMLRLSLDAAVATGSLVTPTIGAALLAAGYDRDFDQLPADAPGPVAPVRVPGPDALVLHGNLLFRAESVVLDLNGVVKGCTVDDALARSGADWVSAGGDLATRVPLLVEVPGGDLVSITAGGLATSSTARRQWRKDGQMQHHLIDPRTGRPARTRWVDVSVAAGSCVAADVAAKAALLLDADGPVWLDERGLPGRFVDGRGKVHVNDAWLAAVPLEAAA